MPIRYVEGIKQARISIKTINPLEAIDLNQTTSTSKIDLNIQQEPSISGDKWGFSESLKSGNNGITYIR